MDHHLLVSLREQVGFVENRNRRMEWIYVPKDNGVENQTTRDTFVRMVSTGVLETRKFRCCSPALWIW
jgi:hypothetical protein